MGTVTVDIERVKGREDMAVEASSDSFDGPIRSGVGQRLRVTFHDLEYVVQNQANKKESIAILKGISGFCNPGESYFADFC